MNHDFNFPGGEYLTKIGASWFVSYSYYLNIDDTHDNWKKIKTVPYRRSIYERCASYHVSFLKEVLSMSDAKLGTNKIGLSPSTVKAMAKELLNKI